MHMAKAVTGPAAEPSERHVKKTNTGRQESFGSQVEHFEMYKGGSELERNKNYKCVVWCVKDPFGSYSKIKFLEYAFRRVSEYNCSI